MRNPLPLTLVTALLLAGCGGGGGSHASKAQKRGAVHLTVIWPARESGRLVPLAANSVVVTLSQNGAALTSQLVARPADGSPAEADFADLPYGALVATVAAYPYPEGPSSTVNANVQAVGSSMVNLESATPVPITISLASTATALAIVPSVSTFKKGETSALTLSATDASGNVVLLAAGGGQDPVAWSVDASGDVTLTTDGGPTATVTGVQKGSATVTAKLVTDDAGDVLTATLPLTVKGGSVSVTVR